MKWGDSIENLQAVDPKTFKGFEQLEIATIGDLLTHYPRRYEDRQNFGRFPDDEQDDPVCLAGEVVSTQFRRLRGRQTMFEVQLQEVGQEMFAKTLMCRWFNAYYIKNMIRTGQCLVIYGRLRRSGRKLSIVHPEFERLDSADQVAGSLHFNRLVPIYPASSGVTQRVLRDAVFEALNELDGGAVTDILPPNDGWFNRKEALWQIHFPEDHDQARRARRHLALEEMYVMQMLVAQRKIKHQRQPGASHAGSTKLVRKFLKGLPFQLTAAQIRVTKEIQADMSRELPMNRLLQGDVGSGKTLVAFCAMLMAVEAGYQAALMAPTQILAEQHYLTCTRMMEDLGLRISLRTGDRREEDFLPLFQQGEGPPHIVIGTHALFYENNNEFEKLGFVVIDEQHKFGVVQRSRLIQRGEMPDTLVMTATPIPRTLALTVYGDLDNSILDERPKNRGKVITAVRSPKKLEAILKFLREQLDEGQQVYVVYPLVEESESLNLKAVTSEFDTWEKHVAPYRCGLLHGRMKPEEKEEVMSRFRDNELQVLVATTVIEVGVDVPNATVMLIENAERFGLAQLHQLRGRVGRGHLKSYCILLTSTEKPEALDKLRIMEKTDDGFRIAEEDLRLRGPGNILGTQQSGLPPLKLADMLGDTRLLQEARELAERSLDEDPDLREMRHRGVRQILEYLRERNFLEVS